MLCYIYSKGPCLISGTVSRDVVASSLQDVVDAAEALKTKGFVNYFGLQRFGTGGIPTHRYGLRRHLCHALPLLHAADTLNASKPCCFKRACPAVGKALRFGQAPTFRKVSTTCQQMGC